MVCYDCMVGEIVYNRWPLLEENNHLSKHSMKIMKPNALCSMRYLRALDCWISNRVLDISCLCSSGPQMYCLKVKLIGPPATISKYSVWKNRTQENGRGRLIFSNCPFCCVMVITNANINWWYLCLSKLFIFYDMNLSMVFGSGVCW